MIMCQLQVIHNPGVFVGQMSQNVMNALSWILVYYFIYVIFYLDPTVYDAFICCMVGKLQLQKIVAMYSGTNIFAIKVYLTPQDLFRDIQAVKGNISCTATTFSKISTFVL